MLGRVPTEKTVTWECVSIRCDPEDSWRDREPTCLRISRDRWTQFLPGVGMALIQQSVLLKSGVKVAVFRRFAREGEIFSRNVCSSR